MVAAVLAKDGTEASYDALLADFERAKRSDARWPLQYKLKRLKKYATLNPAWEAFDAAVRGELSKRDAAAATTSVAKTAGLHVPLLKYSVYVAARERRVPRPTLWVIIDDKYDRHPLQVQAWPTFDEPVKTVLELPRAIAAYAQKHDIRWNWGAARVRSLLRGKYRDAFTQWLAGARAAPVPD